MSRWFVVLVLVLFSLQWVPGAVAVSVLAGTNPGSLVKPKQYLTSANGQYSLVVRPDCNLVVYNDSQPLVGTNFSNQVPCSVWMQADGNFVIYNSTNDSQPPTPEYAIWDTSLFTIMVNRSFLFLGDDGSADFYNSDSVRFSNLFRAIGISSPPVSELNYSDFQVTSAADYSAWKPNSSLADFPYMPVGYFLSAGEKLQTMSQLFTLELGSDCNLRSRGILIGGQINSILWESGSTRTGSGECQLALQPNGLLQILDVNSRVVYWSSNASGVTGVNGTGNWILKGNDDGAWSVNDIKNTSNVLWKTVPILASSYSRKSSTTISLIVTGGVAGVIVATLTVLGLYFFTTKSCWFYIYTRERFLDPEEKAFQARLKAKGGTSYAFSRAKIKQATKNYENVIGIGGFGVVYKGRLSDGREVAAKVLSANSHQSKQEFFNEIELLSMVHHKYLVSLVGFSCTRTHQVLIYEYLGGGDLRQRLQGEGRAELPLSWRQRTNIILQVAEGLEYLHEKCSPPIIHRDVKSTNILLTDQLVAKVADFGLSKLSQENATHVTTLVKGTPGYLDPEYHQNGMLTEKSDVYAFGVVLMEILSGLPHMDIAQKIGEAWREEQVDDLADPNLRDDFDRAEFVSLAELALWCVRRRSPERPLMHEVVRRLYDLGLGGISETVQDELDLGNKNQCHTINIQMVTVGLEDLDSETQRIFMQQYAS